MAVRAWFTIRYAPFSSVLLENDKFLAIMQLSSLPIHGFSRVWWPVRIGTVWRHIWCLLYVTLLAAFFTTNCLIFFERWSWVEKKKNIFPATHLCSQALYWVLLCSGHEQNCGLQLSVHVPSVKILCSLLAPVFCQLLHLGDAFMTCQHS